MRLARQFDEAVTLKMTATTLRAEVGGIRPESSVAKANRLIREHRDRANQTFQRQ